MDERRVNVRAEQEVHLLEGGEGAQEVEFHARVAGVKHLGELRHDVDGHQVGEADAHIAGLAAPGALDVLRKLIRQPQDLARTLEDLLPDGSDCHRPGCALQHGNTEGGFERPDELADRRLRHVQPPGGPAEVQFIRYCHEGAKLADLDSCHRHRISYQDQINITKSVTIPSLIPEAGHAPCRAS